MVGVGGYTIITYYLINTFMCFSCCKGRGFEAPKYSRVYGPLQCILLFALLKHKYSHFKGDIFQRISVKS